MQKTLDPNLDPDPLVRGMDPRIRIHTKMSWIRNTGRNFFVVFSGSRLTAVPDGRRHGHFSEMWQFFKSCMAQDY
jgi:hypothetical protein